MAVFELLTGVSRAVVMAATLGAASVLPAVAQAQTNLLLEVDDLEAIKAACAIDTQSCDAVIAEIIAALQQANPGAPLASLLSAVASEVLAAYNDGELAGGVATTFLTALTTKATNEGLTTLASALTVAAQQVANGETVDLKPVLEASASPS